MPAEILSQYFKWKSNTIRNINSGRAPAPKYYNETFLEIAGSLIEQGHTVDPKNFKKFVEENLPKKEYSHDDYNFEFPTVDGPREWCLSFYERHNMDLGYYDDNPGRKVKNDESMDWDFNEMKKIAYTEMHTYNYESKQWQGDKKEYVRDTYSKDQIGDTLTGLPAQIEQERLQDIRKKLRFRDKCEKTTNRMIKTFLKSMGAYNKVNFAVFKHWLWQVKQFLYNKPVNDPFSINIYSKQGTGKTSFIRGLYSPLEVYSFEPKMDAVKSEGYAKLWSSKYFVFFDEIRIDSSDRKEMYAIMSNYKFLLTMDTNMYRMYHTQDMAEKRRIFSAISSSNQPLVDTIYDPTGMRRFFEIEGTTTADQELYKKLPHIFDRDPDKAEKAHRMYLKLWKGIDENLENGYLTPELKQEVKEIQDTYKKPDCIEMYELYTAEEEEPMVKTEEKDKVEAIMKCIEECKSKKELQNKCRDVGFDAISVKDYRQEVIDWNKDDGGSMVVYGMSKMPRHLQEHGYLVAEMKNIPHIFRSLSYTGF